MGRKLAIWLMWIAALALASGCASMSTEKKYGTLLGASSGALIGGGLGCGIAAANNKNDDTGYVIGCPVGVVAGAIIGGVIGYVMTPEAPPPAHHRLPLRHHLRRRHLLRPPKESSFGACISTSINQTSGLTPCRSSTTRPTF